MNSHGTIPDESPSALAQNTPAPSADAASGTTRRDFLKQSAVAAIVTAAAAPVLTAAGNLYCPTMKLAQIEEKAMALTKAERASLAARLLETLPPPGTDVSDEEVARREREMESGEVAALPHEEFIRRVQQERG